MESRGAAGGQESCGGNRVMPDQSRDEGTWEPGRAGGMTGHSGDVRGRDGGRRQRRGDSHTNADLGTGKPEAYLLHWMKSTEDVPRD